MLADVVLEIGGIGIRLTLEVSDAEALRRTWAGFLGSQSNLAFRATRYMGSEHARKVTPRVTNRKGVWCLSAPGTFLIRRTALASTNEVVFWRHSRDRDGVGIPLCLETGIKALFSVLAVQAGGVLLHSCGRELRGMAEVFAGPSGVGKTTLVRGLPSEKVLSDELVMLFPHDGVVDAHSTPFAGTRGLVGGKRRAPLRSLAVLQRGDRAHATQIRTDEAFSGLLRCVALPIGDPNLEARAFANLGTIAKRVPTYRLVTSRTPSETMRAFLRARSIG